MADVPTEVCPNCGAATLVPIDEFGTAIECNAFEEVQRWACPCGHGRLHLRGRTLAAPDLLS